MQGWFSNRNSEEKSQKTFQRKTDVKINNMFANKPRHQRVKSNVQDMAVNNKILDKPIVQNTNHLFQNKRPQNTKNLELGNEWDLTEI